MRKIRIFLLLLAIVLVLSFAACELPEEELTTEESTTAEETTTAEDTSTESESESETEGEPVYNTITIAEALELCGEPGNVTSERYYIRATIETITNAAYGAMVISDDTGSIEVYGTYSADGSINYSEMDEKPYKGDEVLLYCILQNYNGTKEVKNARLIEFKHVEVEIDESKYTDMSIADAREAAVGTLVKLDGVVARITYSNGMKPAGFYLVDNTNSIYVYNADIAQRVQIGNKITVIGSKTYWILDKEQSSAQKFGYQGCCQIEDATLISNDESTQNEFDKSWIQTSTVKAMVDTPVTENVTSSIYKVNALVKKVPGNGFVNYYFFDLDGETGAYTYTQCNGSDFSWLDEFDGKICTVYLSALNAKSTSTSCYFRFLPIDVIDEGFTFDVADTAEHVVKYYGVGQFLASYQGNPALELIDSVSSTLLGFTGAKLTYSSSDESIIKFETVDGKTVFNCIGTGKVTVTVTCEYNGQKYSQAVEISVVEATDHECISVSDAIGAEVDETVVVKGIVGPSIVNKSGFYLIDETGVIAVIVNDATIFESLEIGNAVIIEGKRDNYKSKDGSHYGQTCITGATVLTNYYGDYEYNTDNFVTDKTLQDVYDLDVSVDYSTTVFVVKATVEVVETAYYKNINLVSGDTSLGLYCSSANQYKWLFDYAGQEVTLEVVPCNWNNKSYYRGCVIAVRTEDGKVVNELNFLD